eukprot:TRINITY_DN3244_c1_g8_i1.p1 TRINITY_DN3244_c1_g8~~TRINITY_DN3244_c1_g8_i1.p1  ORF type:complete len:53 (-),score=5.65 TRINITY_DN3244_c1_g8_i1:442-600(-)
MASHRFKFDSLFTAIKGALRILGICLCVNCVTFSFLFAKLSTQKIHTQLINQ